MVAFDATMLSLLFSGQAKAPLNPKTKQPVEHMQDRVQHLVNSLESAGERIVVPTPALSEFLSFAGPSGPSYLSELNSSSVFKVASFDQRAAIEAAAAYQMALQSGGKRGGSQSPWQKIKVDRQIVAIAKVEGVHTIYSDDSDVETFAARESIQVIGIGELPLPPEDFQGRLFSE